MKKWISSLLLIAFVVVVTPKSWWHACDDHIHLSESDINQDHFESDNCDFCDLSLITFAQPSQFYYSFQKVEISTFTVLISSHFLNQKFNSFSHRGPPLV